MKVRYKIYPTPTGHWKASWDFDEEQAKVVHDLYWLPYDARGIKPPTEAWVLFGGRDREKRKLEQYCENFANILCKKLEYSHEQKKLQEEAPVVEHGCRASS